MNHVSIKSFEINVRALSCEVNSNHINNIHIYNRLINIKDDTVLTQRNRNNKVLYSEETRTFRNMYRHYVKRYKENPTSDNLTILMKNKRMLGKRIKSKKRKLMLQKQCELQDARKSNNNKRYWELIKTNTFNKKKERGYYTSATYFRTQLKAIDSERIKNVAFAHLETMQNRSICTINDIDLDHDITKNEIVDAVK